jgi:hypothetical protein
MAIITVPTIKNLMQIADNKKDGIIAKLIPVARDRIVKITQNPFVQGDIYMTGLSCVFTAGTRTIDASSSFSAEGFAVNDEIRIDFSYRNDGYYTISSIDDDEIVLISANNIVSEISGASITISLVEYPDGIEHALAAMIYYDAYERNKRYGVQSESLGDYSASYFGDNSYGYPRGQLFR